MKTFASAVLLSALLCACGPKPKTNFVDAGEPEVDAGEVDAGRPAGDAPPTGYSVAIEQSTSVPNSSRIGVGLSLVLDHNDQPMVAYVHEDPNGDGLLADNRVMFSRWNGVEKAWQSPVMVEVVGAIDNAAPHRQVSLARDASTGQLAIAYLTANKDVRLATSEDEGAEWSLETASGANPNSHLRANPALAMADGETHLAYFENNAGVYRKRTGQGPGGFSSSVIPLAAGLDVFLGLPNAMAIDSASNPGLAFFARGTSGTNISLLFWRPGISSAAVVADSGGIDDATPSVSLTFRGEMPRLAYHLASATPLVQLRFSEGLDSSGASFAPPVAISRNGPTSGPEGTKFFQDIAVDSAGKIAIAANFATATVPVQACGGPKVARSTDGVSFDVCSPDRSRFVPGFAGMWVNLEYLKSNKLLLSFVYESRSNPDLKAGIILWREP